MKKIETLQDSIRAAMAADVLPITKLALKNGPGSRNGRNGSWFRIVRATNREQKPGAWQFVGDYANNEIEEPPGTVVLGKSTKGHYHLMIVMPGVGLRTLAVAPSATIEMRRQAQMIIDDPASAIETEFTRAMHDSEEAQDLLDRTGQPAKKKSGRNHWTERDTREREWRRRIKDFDAMMDALPTEAPPEKHELRAEHRRLRLRLKHLEAELADV